MPPKRAKSEESVRQVGFAPCSARLQAGKCLNRQCPDHVGAQEKPLTHVLARTCRYMPAELNIVTNNPLGHTAWFRGGLALHGNTESSFNAIGKVLHRLKCDARANFRACANGSGEADPVQAVVDAQANVTRYLNGLLDEIAEQRKRQETVRDCGAIR